MVGDGVNDATSRPRRWASVCMAARKALAAADVYLMRPKAPLVELTEGARRTMIDPARHLAMLGYNAVGWRWRWRSINLLVAAMMMPAVQTVPTWRGAVDVPGGWRGSSRVLPLALSSSPRSSGFVWARSATIRRPETPAIRAVQTTRSPADFRARAVRFDGSFLPPVVDASSQRRTRRFITSVPGPADAPSPISQLSSRSHAT
jgi:hypothetical protein